MSFFGCLLLSRMLIQVAALPTLGQVDLNLLETYEDPTGETNDDLFEILTFRFSCEAKAIGFYADPDYECRIFHVCDETGSAIPLVCPNGMIFNQRERICTDDHESADCEHAHEWFYSNDLPVSVDVTDRSWQFEEEQVPSVLPLSPSDNTEKNF